MPPRTRLGCALGALLRGSSMLGRQLRLWICHGRPVRGTCCSCGSTCLRRRLGSSLRHLLLAAAHVTKVDERCWLCPLGLEPRRLDGPARHLFTHGRSAAAENHCTAVTVTCTSCAATCKHSETQHRTCCHPQRSLAPPSWAAAVEQAAGSAEGAVCCRAEAPGLARPDAAVAVETASLAGV